AASTDRSSSSYQQHLPGWIAQSASTADLPHTLRSLWRCFDGKVFADDRDITVEDATAEETFPDGKDAVPGMFSARFDGGDIEHKFRRVHKILQAHNFPVLMVDAGIGDNFGKLTQNYLNKIEKEKGVLICVCTAHYAEKTSSPFSSFQELQFALDYSLDVLPLKVADVYPPKPPGGPKHPHDQDCEAEALIKMIFRPNLAYKDCRKLDEMEIARLIADKLLKKKQVSGHGGEGGYIQR
ncbi:FAP50, partial [Symbiodinium necroappetens]